MLLLSTLKMPYMYGRLLPRYYIVCLFCALPGFDDTTRRNKGSLGQYLALQDIDHHEPLETGEGSMFALQLLAHLPPLFA